MIPLRDENPARTFPFVTILLIALNVLVFLYELSLGRYLEEAIRQFAVIPYNLTHSLISPAVFLTLFTSLFFHGGLAHLFGNMIFLWVFANNIEDRLGHFRFVLFYLACGLAASFGQVLMKPDSTLPMIGASGAISGVLGAYLFLYPHAKVLVLLPLLYLWRIIKVEALWFLGFWIILQLVYGATSSLSMAGVEGGGVAWFAHIFGFFSGIFFLGIFARGKK